ncbi:MAG: thioredoxin [Gemmatimonadetes bacterium]|nr:MAG: thioredoxin [Gemmatimonadota bacterium]
MGYDTQNFQKDVIEHSYKIPVVVDFWAEWCAPCRVLAPVLEKLAQKHHKDWVLVKVNTDQFPQIAREYGIQGIPNVKLFVDGKVVDEFVGALPEQMIEQWLKKALPSKHRSTLKQAQQHLAAGETEAARQLLQTIIDAEPDNHAARVLLAKTYIFTEPERAVELVKPVEGDSPSFDAAEALRTFAELFHLQQSPVELPESSLKADILDGIQHLTQQDFPAALEKFIEVVGINKNYADGVANRACRAIFNYLGDSHETTQTYRNKFSWALYS